MKHVTILMATYNPSLPWLAEQLMSLNAQTYSDLSLVVLDDCSPDVPLDVIKDAVKTHITAFDFEIHQNQKNLGSCKTFERLTDIAEGGFFAYCDQDDIWEPDKIQKLMDAMDDDATLIYADLSIINEAGEKTHGSLRDIRKRLKHRQGYGLAKKILFRNFVTGCTMIVRADIAKESIPFVSEMIGDHHLALYAAAKGKIQYLDLPLVRYRQHETNVTGIMKGVSDKTDYIAVRIKPLISQFNKLKVTFQSNEDMQSRIDSGLKWLYARLNYLNGKLLYAFVILWFAGFNVLTSFFDLAIPLMPERVFQKALEKIRGQSA